MKDDKKLENIEARYFPPGIILKISDTNELKKKSIDLYNLTENSDIDYIVSQITQIEPLTLNYKSKLKKFLESKIKYLILY